MIHMLNHINLAISEFSSICLWTVRSVFRSTISNICHFSYLSFILYEKPEPNRGLYLYHPGVKHATGITWLMSLSYDNLWNKPQLGQINKVFSFWNTFYPVRLTNSDAKAWSNWCCCIFTMMLIHEWTHPTNDPSCHFYIAYVFYDIPKLWHLFLFIICALKNDSVALSITHIYLSR